MEQQLIEAKDDLSRVESDLWAQQVSFQERSGVAELSRMVSHSHSHTAIKDRRIQGLSSAVPCANDFWVFPHSETFYFTSGLSIRCECISHPISPIASSTSAVAGPRVDQLIDVVTQWMMVMKKGNLGELSCTSISSQSLQMLPILEGQFLSSAVQARHVRRRFGISVEYGSCAWTYL